MQDLYGLWRTLRGGDDFHLADLGGEESVGLVRACHVCLAVIFLGTLGASSLVSSV